MLSTEFTEKIALFYYFFFLDEVKAQAATTRTLKKVRHLYAGRSSAEASVVRPADIVRVTHEFVQKNGREIKPTNLAFSTGQIVLPANSNWGPWFEFRKVAYPQNFHAVLYAKVLRISEAEVAEGLGVSIGTVHYRIGRGLKTLGRICESGADDVD